MMSSFTVLKRPMSQVSSKLDKNHVEPFSDCFVKRDFCYFSYRIKLFFIALFISFFYSSIYKTIQLKSHHASHILQSQSNDFVVQQK